MPQQPIQPNTMGEAPPPQAQSLAGVRVLLVEDEMDMVTLLLVILEQAGAEVAWAMGAAEALACLPCFHPDILLCDVQLPDQDGDWLIKTIRAAEGETQQHLPAIALTSYMREVAESKMLEAGFERFLPKHTDSEDLISNIVELI